ncbi:MAG: cytochrome-c peroxidase, partial [Mesorhizobium sp.]
MPTRRWKSLTIAIATASMFGFAGPANTAGSTHPGPLSRAEAFARAEALTALGRKMFFDPSLSASRKQACSSCHDPDHA